MNLLYAFVIGFIIGWYVRRLIDVWDKKAGIKS
jgi:hypothetical protein